MSPKRPERQGEDERPDRRQASSEERYKQAVADDSDVFLDLPRLKGDEIKLELAKILKLEIKGVETGLLLKANLENVRAVIDKLSDVVDDNPEILRDLLGALRRAVGTATEVAQETLESDGSENQAADQEDRETEERGATRSEGSDTGPDESGEAPRDGVLGETVDGEGRTVRRVVDGFGDIIERVLDENGGVVNEEIVDNVGNLRVQEEHTDDEGRTVRRVRDGTGSVIEEVLDEEGNIAELRVD